MGNKHGKMEVGKDGKRSKSKNRRTNSESDKGRSDDQSNNTTSPFTRGFRTGHSERPVAIQRYQSYGGPSTSGSDNQAQSDTRSYQSSNTAAAPAPTGGRYRSLPRHAGSLPGAMSRSRSVTSSIYQSNGTLNREPLNESFQIKRHSALFPSAHPGLNETRDSIRSTSTYSTATSNRGPTNNATINRGATNNSTINRGATNYRVYADDFPDTAAIKRRLSQFETQFAKHFSAAYARLSEAVQLSAVSIALRLGPTGQHQVSLYDYLTSEDIPLNLNEPQPGNSPQGHHYILNIPESLFHGVKHVRTQRIRDRNQWTSLAKELVTCLAVDVADEISRIFEYQIALLGDGIPLELLARHAVECAVDYLKSGSRFLDRNTLIAGVLHGGGSRVIHDPAANRIISVVIGEREFKWNLALIFQKCGLRKETLLFHPKTRDSCEFCPWTYFTSPDSHPAVYGYRSVVLDRDQAHGFYAVSREDEVRFTAKAPWNPEDIHRRYVPYRRLIGKEVMDEFCRITKDRQDVSLAEYVLKLQGYEYSRDAIQPIYRPLGMVSGLSTRSRIGSSVSSLLSAGSVATDRHAGRRGDSTAAKLHQQFPSAKKIHVTSTLVLRNPSNASTPYANGGGRGHAYPQSAGTMMRSETGSIASGDTGFSRDVPSGFGGPRFRNSATFSRPESASFQPRRLYQSGRPMSATRSVTMTGFPQRSTFDDEPGYGQGTGAYPEHSINHRAALNPSPSVSQGPSPNQRQSVNGVPSLNHAPQRPASSQGRPSSLIQGYETNGAKPNSTNDDFLDFNAFLGMVKHTEPRRSPPKMNGLSNGGTGTLSSALVIEEEEGTLTNGRRYNNVNGYTHQDYDNDARKTAISHV